MHGNPLQSLDDSLNYDFVINLVNLRVIACKPFHRVYRVTNVARMRMGSLRNGKNGFTLYRCSVIDRNFRNPDHNP
ncbi:hypothetical protein D9M71_810770 [compost metagenome]